MQAHWAVLVAGSQGWGNYRHQADALHAYHVLHKVSRAPFGIQQPPVLPQ